jgi:RNA-dependent RNA polymerase
MEIFMRQLNWHYDHHQITAQLAHYLHSPPLWDEPATVFNFDVHLLKDRNGGTRPHIGRGFLTLPTQELGNRFLHLYGDGSRPILVGDRQIFFEESNTPEGKPDIVETIRLIPYRDPQLVKEERRRSQEIADQKIPIRAIQFCWKCRDGVLSVEAEDSPRDCVLFFDEENRQLRVKFFCPDRSDPTGEFGFNYYVAIRLPTIISISAHAYLHRQPVLVLSLNERPTYERGPPDHIVSLAALLQRPSPKRAQLSFLPSIPGHQRVAPFASLAICLVLPSIGSLHQFQYLARLANISRFQDYKYGVDRRGRFSQEAMDEYEAWLPRLSWQVSYQVASIVNGFIC